MRHEITTYPTDAIGQYVGIQNVQKITSPAAATNWSFTFGAGYFYRILSATWQLVTDATVSNRFPSVQLTDGANLLWNVTNVTAVVATTTARVCAFPGAQTGFVGGPNGALHLDIPRTWIPPGYVLSSITPGFAGVDQYSNIVLWLEQLDFGTQGMPMLSHPPTHEELHQVQPALLESFK